MEKMRSAKFKVGQGQNQVRQAPVKRHQVPQAPVNKPTSLELLTRAMILTLTLKRAPEPAMMCFVTYLRIGTRNSGTAATQFIDGTF
jgi:hypothetical protein